MTELDQLSALCERLGASREQAITMAAQLLKRADQLAAEHRIDRTTALAQLVEIVIRGRQGELPSGGAHLTPPPA